ncbi:MAG: SanA/YdcF family protein [Verrucomicrobiales bacterium]
MWKIFFRLLGLALLALLAVVVLVWYADREARLAGEGILFEEAGEVPAKEAGLVFGCAPTVSGRPNLYFKHRMEAAAALWHAGKVEGLLVSGDHSRQGYNEPEEMKRALVAAGVPESRIVCDYAGLRTLDSVVRAREIFGAESVVLVSQQFHNERAAYLAKAHGLDAVGLNAEKVTGYWAQKTERREVLARVKMWLDVVILKKNPKFLGQEEAAPWR